MTALHLVIYGRGPAYDTGRSRRAQVGWHDHATFLDALTERGVVLLGGPIGASVDSGGAALVVSAADEQAVRNLLAGDPWHETVLTIRSVQRWSLWLRSPAVVEALDGTGETPPSAAGTR